MVEVLTPQGMEEMGANMKDLLSQIMPEEVAAAVRSRCPRRSKS